ncbi:hypothetical protein WR25_16238 [Diploscapter pachys]|uniref:Major facilitator superfamily (MFS) profile domain-containing protein n=1 Tax=Diploscapter pachys TaxID=2018661 RepID=A0A2A2KN95_9BILA|nr:hypothetical protein WR25_16238 [Diploscapter pachys]
MMSINSLNVSSPEIRPCVSERSVAFDKNIPEKPERPTKLKMPMSQKDRLKLSRQFSQSANLNSPEPLVYPIPSTPCSIFSFDLPISPGLNPSMRPRYSRTVSAFAGSPNGMATSPDAGIPSSPRSIFSFDVFDFGVLSPPSPSISSAVHPRTPLPLHDDQQMQRLSTIDEGRSSFSFPPPKILGDESLEDTFGDQHPFFQRTHWPSIYFLALIVFLTRIQFTVYLGSLWPFMQQLNSNVTSTNFAMVNAAYSVGLAAAAPLFGIWSNHIGCIRVPSLCSILLMFASNSLMLFVHNTGRHTLHAVLVSRLLSGIAAGGNALLPTYWTYAAEPKDRSTAAALFDSLFCLGIFFGPGSQLIFSHLISDYPGYSFLDGLLYINAYTLPAIFANCLAVVAFFLMLFCFKEVPMYAKEPKKPKRKASLDTETKAGAEADVSDDSSQDTDEEHNSSSAPPGYYLPSPDVIAIVICLLAKFVQMFIYANIETIGSMYTQHMFGLSKSETSNYNSMLAAASGVLGFVFLVSYMVTRCGRRIDNRYGIIVAICLCMSFLVVTYPYWFYDDVPANDECFESWCSMTRRIPQPLYTTAYILVFGIGFAMVNVHLGPLYSSILGPRRQGTMVGVNTLFAGLSRVLGPLLVTVMFSKYGPESIWILQISVWLVLLGAIIVFFGHLAPITYLVIAKNIDNVNHTATGSSAEGEKSKNPDEKQPMI